MMKERPILFSGEMIRAILDGRKTQTRRVIVFPKQWKNDSSMGWIKEIVPYGDNWEVWSFNKCIGEIKCPYGIPGDRLWVKETWGVTSYFDDQKPSDFSWIAEEYEFPEGYMFYKADYEVMNNPQFSKWRPSIFMPRWASRITLEVRNVRVERVQDITKKDACAEGISWSEAFPEGYTASMPENHNFDTAAPSATLAFKKLWNKINGKRPKKNPGAYSWESNPWVWVDEFRVIKT